MAESPANAPPPYTNDSAVPAASAPAPSPTNATFSIEGLRAQILDNVPVIWSFTHGGYKSLPTRFFVTTVQAHRSVPIGTAGMVHATVMFPSSSQSQRNGLEMFVQGPQRDTTEEALRALLAKTEEMLGKRWHMPAGRRVGAAYLEA